MLLRSDTLTRIARGEITLAFRRWRRPTVRAGGTLLTPIGQLSIEAVDRVELDEVTEFEARAAGFGELPALRRRLLERAEGHVYRVRFSLLGPDPRARLRETVPEGGELEGVLARLGRLDASAAEPWTLAVLDLIGERPAVRAGDLAPRLEMELPDFKNRVRKLKGLGLTESLPVGYRLSPRGEAVLSARKPRA